MSTVAETIGAKSQLAAGLADGVNTISSNQAVGFDLYIKVILPIDGYVFWVKADQISNEYLINALNWNDSIKSSIPRSIPSLHIEKQGSLHYSTEINNLEDRTSAVNKIVFTSLSEVEDFNYINPQLMYIATFDGVKFSFNKRRSFYKQADLYHYSGDALYSYMDTQVVDDVSSLELDKVIVSNSLPIWLTLNNYFPMYPSFLVLDNLKPPYASVHIEPSSTQAIQPTPLINNQSSHYQLTRETVKITIYGTRNFNALDFLDYVYGYTLNGGFGIMNYPVPQDEKMTQSEMGIIAQKKIITFDINYYQSNAKSIAQQYINRAVVNYTIN